MGRCPVCGTQNKYYTRCIKCNEKLSLPRWEEMKLYPCIDEYEPKPAHHKLYGKYLMHVAENYLKQMRKTIYPADFFCLYENILRCLVALNGVGEKLGINATRKAFQFRMTIEQEEINLIARHKDFAKTNRKRKIMFFCFEPYIKRMEPSAIDCLNQTLKEFGLWHSFDMMEKYGSYPTWDQKLFPISKEEVELRYNNQIAQKTTGIGDWGTIERMIQNKNIEPYDSDIPEGFSLTGKYILCSDYMSRWDYLRKLGKRSGCYVILSYKKSTFGKHDFHDVYVGQSSNVYNRVRNHLTGHGNGDVYADVKNGDVLYIKVILCKAEMMNDLEKYLIKLYDATHSYNKTSGGASRR